MPPTPMPAMFIFSLGGDLPRAAQHVARERWRRHRPARRTAGQTLDGRDVRHGFPPAVCGDVTPPTPPVVGASVERVFPGGRRHPSVCRPTWSSAAVATLVRRGSTGRSLYCRAWGRSGHDRAAIFLVSDPAGRGPALPGPRPAPDARRRGRPRGQVRDAPRGRGLRLRSLGVPRADPLLPDPALGLAPGRPAVRRDRRGHPARRARRARGGARRRPPRGGPLPGHGRRRGRGPAGRDLPGHGLLQPLLHPRDPARLLQLRRAARGGLVPEEARRPPGPRDGRRAWG